MHTYFTLCPYDLPLMKYAKELKLVRVEVGVSLSGTSELDMKVPKRRHYNVLLFGPLSIT